MKFPGLVLLTIVPCTLPAVIGIPMASREYDNIAAWQAGIQMSKLHGYLNNQHKKSTDFSAIFHIFAQTLKPLLTEPECLPCLNDLMVRAVLRDFKMQIVLDWMQPPVIEAQQHPEHPTIFRCLSKLFYQDVEPIGVGKLYLPDATVLTTAFTDFIVWGLMYEAFENDKPEFAYELTKWISRPENGCEFLIVKQNQVWSSQWRSMADLIISEMVRNSLEYLR